VITGGYPVRVLRLSPAGARHVAGWWDGAPVPGNAKARALARRLLDTGIAHPWLDRGQAERPEVTVVIPVRDRHAELARCLAGLAGTPRVIVVDDGSADPAAIHSVAAAAGASVVRRPVNGGPAAARNTGLAAAQTPLVAFLDSDCVPGAGPANWLDALLPHFADPAVGAVAPRIVPHEAGRTWLARYEGVSSTLDMGRRPSIVRPGSRVPYVPGASLVVRREAAGAGFAEDMRVGEDVDFVWRLAASGWRVRYEPAATMGHQHRVRLREWFARRKDYGTSAAVLELRHPGAVRPLYASAWTAAAWLPAAGPGHRRGLARSGRIGRVAAGHRPGRRRDARRGPPAGQRDLSDLVAAGAAGRDRGTPAAGAAGRAGASAAAAGLARPQAAARSGAVRGRPVARRRRVQRGGVAGVRGAQDRSAPTPGAARA
jgi:mycofactocin glycosyltransferase